MLGSLEPATKEPKEFLLSTSVCCRLGSGSPSRPRSSSIREARAPGTKRFLNVFFYADSRGVVWHVQRYAKKHNKVEAKK